LGPASGQPPTEERPELRVDALRNQQRILRAAARLLAEDPSVSVQRIAAEAEVARPTVYRRYPTRDALVEAILREATVEVATVIAQAQDSPGDVVAAIRQMIFSLAEIGVSYPILLGAPGLDLHHHDGVGQAGSLGDEAFRAFDALLGRGQAQGLIRADVSPPVLRHSIMGALAVSLRVAARSEASVAAVAIGEQVADLLLDGARPRT
jgi:AcrR family transcriptional regulator